MSKEATLNEQIRFTNKVVKDGLRKVSTHHVESFNYALGKCLPRICKYMLPVEVSSGGQANEAPEAANGQKGVQYPFQKYQIWYENFELRKPTRPRANDSSLTLSSGSADSALLYPAECRLRSLTYTAPLYATVCRRIDNEPEEKINIHVGDIPVMVNSDFCNLSGLTEEELVKKKEDEHEFGGYFIINGNERIIRMLIMNKRNYPVAFQRGSFINRGRFFTPYAVQMRCVREDMMAQTVTLHYLSDGNCVMKFIYQKQEFLVPAYVLLVAMSQSTSGSDGITHAQIYNRLVKGYFKNRQIGDKVEVLLGDGEKLGLFSPEKCLQYLGSRFRTVLDGVTQDMNDVEVGRFLLDRVVLIHAANYKDKFNIFCLMIEKLYAFVAGECEGDNLDSVGNQETLLGGHLYGQLLAEKLQDALGGAKAKLLKDLKNPKFDTQQIRNPNYLKKLLDAQTGIGKKMEHFLATGNLLSKSQLDLQQTAGFTIVADKLNNIRYLSHFRSIHRGQYFTEMKTTTVRKLLPEAWGFICPVHTPDGSPCGLLNHITLSNFPLAQEEVNMHDHMHNFKTLLTQLGMHANQSDFNLIYPERYLPIVLDGILMGYVDPKMAPHLVNSLRAIKVAETRENELYECVPTTLEVAYLPPGRQSTAPSDNDAGERGEKHYFFPGIYLSSQVSRMCRPVQNLVAGGTEWIGPLEQVSMSIATLEEDIRLDTTHQELDQLNMLSIIASTIPFCNYNQSPRNMYQCQMAKQTMGTPYHNHPYRMDNKVYRLLFPQAPMVRTENHDKYDFGLCPSGTNAVVAVISYTGYDMEDAMIINKGAFERGFGHAAVYKSYLKELNPEGTGKSKFRLVKAQKDRVEPEKQGLDQDGLPFVGQKLEQGQAEQCVYDTVLQKAKFTQFKDQESARVESVRLMGDEKDPSHCDIGYTIRYSRNPVIGDKFSSRHGQKGVLSVIWPQEDMPFTESGITPDILINPHAFPSRMTIGMLIESLAGKGGAMNGEFINTKPFEKYEDDDIVDFYGKELLKHGYNYYGNETMYSGI